MSTHSPPRDEPDHGTLARYRGSTTRPPCHCELCKAANSEQAKQYTRAYNERRRAERRPFIDADGAERKVHPYPTGGHGSFTTRKVNQCGCAACRHAERLGANLSPDELAEYADELAAIEAWAAALGPDA